MGSRVDTLVAKLKAAHVIPTPWNLDLFIQACASQRKRPIHVRGLPHALGHSEGGNDISALAICLPDYDIIIHRCDRPPLWVEHAVLHEMCHLLLHVDQEGLSAASLLESLFGDLFSSEGLTNALSFHRSALDQPIELEAEEFASLILADATSARSDHRVRIRGRYGFMA